MKFFWKKEQTDEVEEESSPTKKYFSVALLVLMVVVTISIRLSNTPQTPRSTQNTTPEAQEALLPTLSFGTTTLSVILADTDALRVRGLSGKTGLPASTGMLFEFDSDSHPQIWMKDMLFSIDILWLDDNFTVVELAENISPETFPKIFSSRIPARYVLEVPAGFSRAHGLRVGSAGTFSR